MLDDRTKTIMLYDFYGALLTDRQREYVQLHFLEDCSLMEIAQEYSVSRQAVHDALKRAEIVLSDFETKLRLFERWGLEKEMLLELNRELHKRPGNIDLGKCRALIRAVLEDGGE